MTKYFLLSVLLLGLTLGGSAAFGAPGCTMQNVGLSTVAPHWTRTFAWTIDKSVTPSTYELFPGDSGTSSYTVSVTKDAGTDAWWVDGNINVQNGNTENSTIGLSVTATLQYKVGSTVTTVASDSPAVADIGPLTQVWVPYHIALPQSPASYGATAWQVYVVVHVDNHSGKTVGPKDTTATISFTWPSAPTLVNDAINVDDTNGSSWAFTGSGSVSYDRTFTVADAPAVDNTATIRETGQSDEATVTIVPLTLGVTKDANTSFTRTWTWAIDKQADKTSAEIDLGDSVTVNYTVNVSATSADSDFKVTGTITIANPSALDRKVTVNDPLANITAAVFTVPAGGKVEVPYTIEQTDGTAGTNTATVTLQNLSFNADGTYAEAGTTDSSASADFAWDLDNPTNVVDESVAVTDNLAGDLGTANAPGQTFTYALTFTPTEIGDTTYVNTATFTTTDTGTTGSDDATVVITVKNPITYSSYGTGWAYGDIPFTDLGFKKWGWVISYDGGTVVTPLYVGAGGGDTDHGTIVGSVTIEPGPFGTSVTYHVDAPYAMTAVHVYAGDTTPDTVAPGQFDYVLDGLLNVTDYTVDVLGVPQYLAIHADVSKQD